LMSCVEDMLGKSGFCSIVSNVLYVFFKSCLKVPTCLSYISFRTAATF
jgi:hypothetical protein